MNNFLFKSARFIILIILITFSCTSHQSVKNEKFNELIGKYKLDIHRTSLGEYSLDSNIYNKLELFLNADSTYSMNMEVPFIYDRYGTWETGGNYLEDMNILTSKSNNLIKTQFTILYYHNGDSIFYLNSNTPKKGEIPIHKVCFIKD